MNYKNKLTLIILSTLLTTYSYAKDNITFNCSATGNGFQSSDKKGPSRYDLGSFKWEYNADMIKAESKIKLKNDGYGCKPVDIKSPMIILDKEKSIHITGSRCGDDIPSYFFTTTTLNDLQINHSIGYVDDVIKDKYVRIIFDSATESDIQNKDKKFKNIYFDCNVSNI